MEPVLIECKACGNQFHGKYCNQCGEKVYTEHDRSVIHFFEESLHFITHFEGSLFTTLKTICSQPGQLSVQWCNGLRKRFFKPISFFLLLVVIYLLFPFFEGLNMKLYYHLRHFIYGDFAMEKAKEVLAITKMSDAELGLLFQKKSAVTSKFLLLIIIPLTALFFWALSFRKRKLFYDQVIFSTEINSMYLLWGFMILPLLFALTFKLMQLINVPWKGTADGYIGIIMYAVLCVYVAVAARRFYGLSILQGIGFAVLFYVIHFIVVQVLYKFLLFALVINQIN